MPIRAAPEQDHLGSTREPALRSGFHLPMHEVEEELRQIWVGRFSSISNYRERRLQVLVHLVLPRTRACWEAPRTSRSPARRP